MLACGFEALETRLQLSAIIPANSIGTSAGSVLQPGGHERRQRDGRRPKT